MSSQTATQTVVDVTPTAVLPTTKSSLPAVLLRDDKERDKATQLARQINVRDTKSVMDYGAPAQQKMAQFTDAVLAQVRTVDTGVVGDRMTEIILEAKQLNVGKLGNGQSWADKVPLLRKVFGRVYKFKAQFDSSLSQIEKIVSEVEVAQSGLIQRIILLENMFHENINKIRDLDIYIAAGQIEVKRLNEEEIPALEREVQSSKDPIKAQELKDLKDCRDRFEKKLDHLLRTRMLAIQTAPTIRNLQNTNATVAEKITSIKGLTIPVWKEQFIQAIAAIEQQKAIALVNTIDDFTNEMIQATSDQVKQNSINAAKASNRSVIDIETLQKVNENLFTTLDEVKRINDEGRQQRQQVQVQLQQMEQSLKEKFTAA